MRPRALDLFCGAGGASMGLHRAGFDVVGIDHRPQSRYPFRFVRGDALQPPVRLDDFDFVWASPPCQAYTMAGHGERARGKVYPDLVAATRDLLAGHPGTCIENVPRAPLRVGLKLDGWMFPELRVIRERWFELSWFQLASPISRPGGLLKRGYLCPVGNGTPSWLRQHGVRQRPDDCRAAMGIPWMTRAELSQAIPPAYAEFIGLAFLAQRTARAA